jgi:UDP:flavonoid glycosyltransferase YjiC (YdhE family)
MSGDVQPFLALGMALQSAGHEILFTTAARWRRRVEQFGLPFVASGYPIAEADDRVMLERMLAEPNPLKQAGLTISSPASCGGGPGIPPG